MPLVPWPLLGIVAVLAFNVGFVVGRRLGGSRRDSTRQASATTPRPVRDLVEVRLLCPGKAPASPAALLQDVVARIDAEHDSGPTKDAAPSYALGFHLGLTRAAEAVNRHPILEAARGRVRVPVGAACGCCGAGEGEMHVYGACCQRHPDGPALVARDSAGAVEADDPNAVAAKAPQLDHAAAHDLALRLCTAHELALDAGHDKVHAWINVARVAHRDLAPAASSKAAPAKGGDRG